MKHCVGNIQNFKC